MPILFTLYLIVVCLNCRSVHILAQGEQSFWFNVRLIAPSPPPESGSLSLANVRVTKLYISGYNEKGPLMTSSGRLNTQFRHHSAIKLSLMRSGVARPMITRQAYYGAYRAGSNLSERDVGACVCHLADLKLFCHTRTRQTYKLITRREVSFI
jgi:hypothetical protein